MIIKHIFVLPVFALALIGCASTKAVPSGHGTYIIDEHVSVFRTDDDLWKDRDRMEKAAKELCGKSGKNIEIVSSHFNTNVPFWRSGSARFEFMCVDL